MERKFYVYAYLDINDKVVYVGKGKGRRYLDHLSSAFSSKKRTYFLNWVKKYIDQYKENPQTIFVVKHLTEEDAFILEKCLIKKYGKRVNKTGNLLNMTDGGEGVCGFKRVISEKERHERSIRMIGHKTSEEIKKKISDTLTGRKLTEDHKQKLRDNSSRKGKVSDHKGKTLDEICKHSNPDEIRRKLSEMSKARQQGDEYKNKRLIAGSGTNNNNSKFIYRFINNSIEYNNVTDIKKFCLDKPELNYKMIRVTFSNKKSYSIQYKNWIIERFSKP